MPFDLTNICTPKELLNQSTFPEPEIISPDNCSCFEDLLNKRKDIAELKYVPIKSNTLHDLYNSLNKETLLEKLIEKLKDKEILIQPNEFPYFLPSDCSQKLIWVKNENVSEETICTTIKEYCFKNYINLEKIILFERPINTTDKYVKGTFKFIRHIHFWHKTILA